MKEPFAQHIKTPFFPLDKKEIKKEKSIPLTPVQTGSQLLVQ